MQGHRDGYGFLLCDDGQPDVYLSPEGMGGALHGDRVKVSVSVYEQYPKPHGRVIEIISRPTQSIIGRLKRHTGGVWLVEPEDPRFSQSIMVPKTALGQALEGQVVVVELSGPPAVYGHPLGRIIEVLGEIDDPGLEIEIAVRKFHVPHEFSPAALEQSRALPESVRQGDKQGRVDLTDLPLVTIDGEDARDFDDAVYCEPAVVKGRGKKPNGWRLIVAIADVSHYVKSGSALDSDAYDRATSVYFPRRVIAMLPEKLSNGLCSLNPNVERLCMVCDILIDQEGQICAYQFYPAVMFSHARFTYTEVAAILTNTRGPEAARNASRVGDLLHLYDLFQALLKARQARGALDFETVETQIICDEQGRIERIEPRRRNQAHRLIEECMLAANVCAASFVAQNHHPSLYRIHDEPSTEKVKTLQAYLQSLGLSFSFSEPPKRAQFQHIAEQTAQRPDASNIAVMMLRSMSQAVYSPYLSGHFGLGFEAYTHFTSPIRRYPDLLVHRVIKSILRNRQYSLPPLPELDDAAKRMQKRLKTDHVAHDANGSSNPVVDANAKADTLAWENAGMHCSANERRADEASRDVEAWLKCRFMRDRLGNVYEGTISAVTGFGVFVTLDELFVEGLVHISELGSDYFAFDQSSQQLRGMRTGICFKIGAKLTVQVTGVDLSSRRIVFRIITNKNKDKDDKGQELTIKPKAKKTFNTSQKGATPKKKSATKAKRGATRKTGVASAAKRRSDTKKT